MMKTRTALTVAALVAAMTIGPVLSAAAQNNAPAATAPAETQAQRDKRMKWFREARFGMFIHWGLYAVPGGVWKGQEVPGVGEWIMNSAKIPVAEYEPLQQQFNPVRFNAKEWVSIAKNAGMKYIVITSKHHDGFALWDSKLTDWDIMGTPFQRDVLKELAAECKRQGIKLCFYHSIMDWHHPDYLPRRDWDKREGVPADFDRYVAYMKGQLKELVTGYGPLGILWFDGEWESTWTHERGKDLYAYVRSLQPNIIINNRVDKGRAGMQGLTRRDSDYAGDYGTPEQEIPPTGLPGIDWESCMTMNDTWGFKKNDHNWKSAETLIRNLVDIASKGGNYLLNVGPTPEGEIPGASVERLRVMGDWLKRNGEAIYGTTASPFPKPLSWGRVTKKPGRLYLHVFDRGNGSIVLPGLTAKVKRVYALGDRGRKPITCATNSDGIAVTLPAARASDGPVSVFVIEIDGEPTVTAVPLGQDRNGVVTLSATEATVHGEAARYEADKNAIGFWTNPKDTVSWEFVLRQPGTFAVEVEIACANGADGAAYTVTVDGEKLSRTVASTGGWDRFVKVNMGNITLAQPGRKTLTVTPTAMEKGAVMNLRAIRLLPVGNQTP